MQELEDIKIKMAQIKLSQMEKTLNGINVQYMKTIHELRHKLKQKNDKQTKLTLELQGLRKEYSQHNQQVKEALSSLQFKGQSPSGTDIHSNMQRILEKSPIIRDKYHVKQKSGYLDVLSKTSEKASTQEPPSTNKQFSKKQQSQKQQNGNKKISYRQPISFRKKHQLLKNKSSTQFQFNSSKGKGIRSSYDENKRNVKHSLNSQGLFLRKSEKMIRNPEYQPKKY